MKAFIKSLDEKAWIVVIEGWSPPIVKDKEGKEMLKDVKQWFTEINPQIFTFKPLVNESLQMHHPFTNLPLAKMTRITIPLYQFTNVSYSTRT